MPSTDNYKIPLYTDGESPDLSTTGHYNRAMAIIDTTMTSLGDRITQETTARTNGDNALAERITTVEGLGTQLADRITTVEGLGTQLAEGIAIANHNISANTADLTGIKGLTYGADHVQFLVENNGSYTSPALDEIAEQITNASAGITANTQWSQIEA